MNGMYYLADLLFFYSRRRTNSEFRREVSHGIQVGNISRGGAQHGATTPLRAACSSQKKPVEFAFIAGVVKRSTRVE